MSIFGYSGGGSFRQSFTPAVRNLVIINFLIWIASRFNSETMYTQFALFPLGSPFFHPWQVVTHMFMHGDFWHIFFNMYTLMMFGMPLERVWGTKKFLVFYFVTGLGAAALHLLVLHLQVNGLMAAETTEATLKAYQILSTPTVGASGAIYGVLLGFAMLYPSAELRLLFLPFFPIKAKWLVLIFAAIELLTGLFASSSSIAHFAHLGGMLFGWLLILYWKKRRKFYDNNI